VSESADVDEDVDVDGDLNVAVGGESTGHVAVAVHVIDNVEVHVEGLVVLRPSAQGEASLVPWQGV
jgi:hypothetical protein